MAPTPAAPGAASHPGRLVPSPVFVFAPMRSGSTLLRVLMNSHPQICAPHEMHLRTLRVDVTKPFTNEAMEHLGLQREELEHLLWDRVLHYVLVRSRKQLIVDKTPANVLHWSRIDRAWPDARYIFVLRHPGAVFTSLVDRRRNPDRDAICAELLTYVEHIDAARQSLPGLVVRYEDLTNQPVETTKRVCEHLGVAWDARMIDYGRHDHGPFKPYLGDWSKKIRSGQIEPADLPPSPGSYPRELDAAIERWGYATAVRVAS